MWGGHLVRPGRVRHPSHKSFFMHYFSRVSLVGCVSFSVTHLY
ncbi:hypothetical protein FDUTEX481_00463 [Tolypothrix sp. PCC 7601]|nr:hypothetical protein FDUTEX481_00463 [Tolypothrix sp. PCC 7601]